MEGCGQTQQLPAVNASHCMTVKITDEKKKKNVLGQTTLNLQIQFWKKKDKHTNWPPYLPLTSVQFVICHLWV